MAHDVLEDLRIHSGTGHIRAERMTASMRRYVRKRFVGMELAVLAQGPTELILYVKSDLRTIVLVDQEKSTVPINQELLLYSWTFLEDVFQSLKYIIGHRNKASPAFSLCLLYIVTSLVVSKNLMVDTDALVLEIKIVDRKATELTDAHPGSEQYHELVITLAVGFVVLLDQIQSSFFDEGIVFDREGLRNVFVWGVQNKIHFEIEWKPEYYYLMTNVNFGSPMLSKERELINPAFPILCIGICDTHALLDTCFFSG